MLALWNIKQIHLRGCFMPPLFRGSSREKEILKSDLRNIGFFVCGTVYGFVRCRPELIGNMLLSTHVM